MLGSDHRESMRARIEGLDHYVRFLQEVHKKDTLWKEQAEKDIGTLKSWKKELPDTLNELLQSKVSKDGPEMTKFSYLDTFQQRHE